MYSFTQSFDETTESNQITGGGGGGRPSNMYNEDDYDYAIELKAEYEYREIAARRSNFIDFSDIDLNKLNINEEESNNNNNNTLNDNDNDNNDDHSVSTFDSRSSKNNNNSNHNHNNTQNNNNSYNESNECIDKRSFLKKMYNLSKRKVWIETVSRRSTILYMTNRIASDDEIRHKFNLLLSNGIKVRRHEKYKFAEVVTLFGEWIKDVSSNNEQSDCLSKIIWEPEESFRIRKEMNTNNRIERDTSDVLDTEENDMGEWTLGRFARYCGCGDNLFRGVKEDQYTGRTSISRANIHLDSYYQESIEANKLYNSGFKRKGSISIIDIIAIQPAHQPDPTHLGEIATTNFRGSLDEFNPHLSFSIVIKSLFSIHGVKTLDIECDNEETYITLLSGLLLLVHSTLKNKVELKKQKSEVIKRVTSEFQKVIVQSPRRMLSTMKSTLYSSVGIKNITNEDPFEKMFFPDLEKGETSISIINFVKENNLSPPAQFLGWNTKGTQIWARLKMAGLDVKPIFSWDLKRVILKIRCPDWRLEEVAEKMHIRLRLRNGGYKRFKISQKDHYATTYDGKTIFRSSERQKIIDFILRSKIKDGGAELDEHTKLGDAIVQRFPLHMITRVEDLKNSWIFFWRAEQPGEIPLPWSPFSTPISITLNRIYLSSMYFFNGLLNQPLDQIAEYYGESIAFYFAWNAFFTRWLILPSILGIIVFIVQITSKELDHWICVPFGIFIVIWCSLMLVFWRQKQSALAYRWGALGFEMEETERPQFKGKSVYNPTTQEMRKVYSPRKRLGKYLIAIPCMLFLTCIMLLVMMIVLSSQEKITQDYNEGKTLGYMPSLDIFLENPSNFYSNSNSTKVNGPNLALGKLFTFDSSYWMAMMYFPSMYGLIVSLVSEFVDYAAFKLTDFENHRKESTYWSRLILKIFCFRFVAVFTPVYYYAFFVQNHEEAYIKMFMCILALMTVGDWWKKFLSTCIPAWIHKFQLYRLSLSLSETNRLIWEAKWKNEFTSSSTLNSNTNNNTNKVDINKLLILRREHYHHDAKSSTWGEALKQEFTGIEDYTSAILQLGFVLMFGIVFPLGPIVALFNNLFFIRIDAAKLLFTRKRPIAKKIGGLGIWEDVLQIMSVIGILTNCCLMLFTSTTLRRLLPFLGVGGVAIVLFAYEHLMLFLKYFLHTSINRIPESVQRDQERTRILNQKRRDEKYDRLKKYEEEDENGKKKSKFSHNENKMQPFSSFPSFSSLVNSKGPTNNQQNTVISNNNEYFNSNGTLAADPFEFDSEGEVEDLHNEIYSIGRNNDEVKYDSNNLPPLSRIGEINLSEMEYRKSLSPLFQILRLNEPIANNYKDIQNFRELTQLSPSPSSPSLSSSSSSDSESYSLKSQGRYTLPRSLNQSSGPGPVKIGSTNQLKREQLPSVHKEINSRRETLQSESVASFDENDEECWKIQSLTQIDTLSSVRKPLGPNRIQCINTNNQNINSNNLNSPYNNIIISPSSSSSPPIKSTSPLQLSLSNQNNNNSNNNNYNNYHSNDIFNNIMTISTPPEHSPPIQLKRSSTFASSISSLTGPSTWNDPNDLNESNESNSFATNRASLLQAPFEESIPKPLRELRKLSVGVNSTSPSLRPSRTTSPQYQQLIHQEIQLNEKNKEITLSTPTSIPNINSNTPQSIKSKLSLSNSPIINRSPLDTKEKIIKYSTPPSAPLPKKLPPRTPDNQTSSSQQIIEKEKNISESNNLPLLLSRPKVVQSRRLPQRTEFCMDDNINIFSNNKINSSQNNNQDNNNNGISVEANENDENNVMLSELKYTQDNEEVEIQNKEEEENNYNNNDYNDYENVNQEIFNNENDVYVSNSPQLRSSINQNIPSKTPSPKILQLNSIIKKDTTPKESLRDPPKGTPKVIRKIIKETKESPSNMLNKKIISPAKKLPSNPHQNSQLKQKQINNITTSQPIENPKLTFQQRIDSWLKHTEHREDAPNPFLSVLKEE